MRNPLCKETRLVFLTWLFFMIALLLMQGCATKHHVITEDGVNWYTTEEQE